jgi:hypothetical protein
MKRLITLLFAATICTVTAAAQGGPPPGGGGPRGPRPAPTNIKALPKNITGDEVFKLMRQYEGDLGVECTFCHAADPTTKRAIPALDTNPVKNGARYMITMTADLNEKYLAEMPDRRYADPITCGTCHRGEKHPSIYVPPARPQGPPGGGPPPAGMPGAPTRPGAAVIPPTR